VGNEIKTPALGFFLNDIGDLWKFDCLSQNATCIEYENACLNVLSWVYKFYMSDDFTTNNRRSIISGELLELQGWFDCVFVKVTIISNVTTEKSKLYTINVNIRLEGRSDFCFADTFVYGFDKQKFESLKVGSRGAMPITTGSFMLLDKTNML
jgi:hypothetical protein